MTATRFWVAMISTPDSALAKADPAKLAAKYSIPESWAKFWLATWRERDR